MWLLVISSLLVLLLFGSKPLHFSLAITLVWPLLLFLLEYSQSQHSGQSKLLKCKPYHDHPPQNPPVAHILELTPKSSGRLLLFTLWCSSLGFSALTSQFSSPSHSASASPAILWTHPTCCHLRVFAWCHFFWITHCGFLSQLFKFLLKCHFLRELTPIIPFKFAFCPVLLGWSFPFPCFGFLCSTAFHLTHQIFLPIFFHWLHLLSRTEIFSVFCLNLSV
jgi:hypothetical protein